MNIDNPELPAHTGITGGSSDEHYMDLETGPCVPGAPWRLLPGCKRHRLLLPTMATREIYIRALLEAAEALGWRQ